MNYLNQKIEMNLVKLTSVMFFCFCLSSQISAQKELTITITSDDFPQDITWELQNQNCKEIVASGDMMGCLPNETCVVYSEMVVDDCYTLLLRDRNKDGIQAPGGYTVFYGGELVVESEAFTERVYHDFNCGPGQTCSQAIVLSLPDRDIFAPDTHEFWLEFTPEEDGHYRINTCDNRQTGVGVADTQLWYYDDCNRDLHTCGAEGSLNFSDDTFDCAPGSGFNFIPLEEGITYYIRHRPLVDWTNIIHNDSLKIKVQKLPVRKGCIDSTACNYDPFAQLDNLPDNGSCFYSVECAPDLSLDVEELRSTIMVDTVFSNDLCFVEEGCLKGEGPREVIRFSTKIDNIGNADYVVGRPESSPDLFDDNNCHGHNHHLGYAEYLIYRGEGQPEPVGFKSGFCVLDLDCSDAGGTLPKYICAYMGITAGCSDIYDEDIDCQWIDITDLDDGQYTIVVRINHFRLPDLRGLHEKTFDNNTGQACVEIDRSSGKLVVNVLEDCEQYVDCLGNLNGDAVIDCNGDCGGTAHFGDLDGTGELEVNDLMLYLDMLESGLAEPTVCSDLNGDGEFSIADAALVYDCLEEKAENIDNPFHDHCSFPGGGTNLNDMGIIRISEFSATESYIDLEAWIPDRDLAAYQINVDGVKIESVEKLYTQAADQLMHNGSAVFAMHGVTNLTRNTDFEPFIRINYSDVLSDNICISTTSEFVNNMYDNISVIIEDGCRSLTDTDEIQKRLISIHPNPALDRIRVNTGDHLAVKCDIINLDGKSVFSDNIDPVSNFDIPVTSLPEGLYVLKISFQDGINATQKFMKAN